MKTNPSDFTNDPYGCVFRKAEHERIAQNIMVILERTGNNFRELSYKEYEIERLKDGNYSDYEKRFFDDVIKYCSSAEKAKTFSKQWSE